MKRCLGCCRSRCGLWVTGLVTLAVALIGGNAHGQFESLQKVPPIERVVPPKGLDLSPEQREALVAKLTKVEQAYGEAMQSRSSMIADIAVLIKAVQYAIQNGEFYKERDFEKVDALLELAEERIGQWSKNGETPWARATGMVVRGLFSKIDSSPQPYAVEIPDGLDFDKPSPLYVWLHGRGDKTTDLHFLYERLKKPSAFAHSNGILIHPFGRQCLGYKSAGETDVLEIIKFAKTAYNIDPDRVVLMGFSMGGAGAWHLGAHFADQFCAVHAGAGFAETALYNRLKPEQYPPVFEQTLWKQYDVPNYARNFLNVPLVAYSGEIDKQKQAADVMAAALAEHGHTLKHVIGPGMEHKYHPDSEIEIKSFVEAAVAKGRDRYPQNVSLQTPTLHYNRMHWIAAHGLRQHWIDSRIDASYDKDTRAVDVTTKNITRFEINLPFDVRSLTLNGTELDVFEKNDGEFFIERNPAGEWINFSPKNLLGVKKPGLQGPIDDAFTDSFLVVLQSESSGNPLLDRWILFEFEHFDKRWYELFRGSFRHKKDTEVTMEDLKNSNLILFGTKQSNKVWEQLDLAAKNDPSLAWPGVGEASTQLRLKALPPEGSESVTVEQLGLLAATLRTRLQPNRQPNGSVVQTRGVDGIEIIFKDWEARRHRAREKISHQPWHTRHPFGKAWLHRTGEKSRQRSAN